MPKKKTKRHTRGKVRCWSHEELIIVLGGILIALVVSGMFFMSR